MTLESNDPVPLQMRFDHFRDRKIIVASVGRGPYRNFGNALIERSTFRLLGLPVDTPCFSVFERISDHLLEQINEYDYVLVTGCTTLQDTPHNQVCFDSQWRRIRGRTICFGGTFFCEPDDKPSLRIAEFYGTPIGVRDPWSLDYLTANGIPCALVGCPTLLDGESLSSWRNNPGGDVLESSTPPLPQHVRPSTATSTRLIAHRQDAAGEDIRDPSIFSRASLVITSRLHAALPAIARGIPVGFYNPLLGGGMKKCGSIRFSLLEYLGIPLDGTLAPEYPRRQLDELRQACSKWLDDVMAA